ncbi:MAG TPA: VOC family protein [Thermoanaerobaculia bacterium]
MFGDNDAIATIAVKDLKVARKFYEQTLGLKPMESNEPSVAQYSSGKSSVLVYESRYAGTNQATAATWSVGGDIEAIVRTLKSRGVAFEHYALPGLTVKGDIHVAGNFKAAWFKDPDGNILQIVTR